MAKTLVPANSLIATLGPVADVPLLSLERSVLGSVTFLLLPATIAATRLIPPSAWATGTEPGRQVGSLRKQHKCLA